VFDALRDLTASYGLHFRRTTPPARNIQIASFGANSGYVLTNIPLLNESANVRNTASIIAPPNTSIDRTQIVNRVIAYGGKYNSSVLMLPLSNRVETSSVVKNRTRNGTVEHYIENTASITKYGVREKVIRFGEITPASTSTEDIERAEDVLKTRAVAFLSRWGMPIITHTFTTPVFNRVVCRVGDLLTVNYEEKISDDTTISINDTFFLTEVSASFNASGNVTYNLKVSDTNRVQTDDREALVATMKRLEEIKLEDIT